MESGHSGEYLFSAKHAAAVESVVAVPSDP